MLVFLVAGFFSCSQKSQEQPMKPRLLVLTDIGGDPDDQQSMIRLCLYSNEFDIEGLIASASGTPGELDEAIVQPQLIKEIIRGYGAVRPNLLLHHEGYPEAEYLLSMVKSGNPNRGLSYIGEGHDTEGSQWIIQVADKPDNRRLNISIWGGQTDLFQALWKVKNTRSEHSYRQFISRLRIYDIADQDGIFDEQYPQHRGLFYILNQAAKGEDKRNAAFRGMYLGGDESLTSQQWIETHVSQNHGPLGALYPLETWTAPNPHGVMKEGDTPSWFYFLSMGLSNPDHPGWGGWGGRFKARENHFIDAEDQVEEVPSARATVWRWRPRFQHDFQARLDWCVKPRQEANHRPEAVINGDRGKAIIETKALAGQKVWLNARGSSDPDGNNLSYLWYIYPEPGTYRRRVSISETGSQNSALSIPEDAVKGQTIHVILEVSDDGSPNLCSYRRMVITIDQ